MRGEGGDPGATKRELLRPHLLSTSLIPRHGHTHAELEFNHPTARRLLCSPASQPAGSWLMVSSNRQAKGDGMRTPRSQP